MGTYIWCVLLLSHIGVINTLISCDFEDGLCDWSDVSKTKYNWTICSGRSPDYTSGPLYDHTFTDHFGHYVFTHGGRASRTAVAVLKSKEINITRTVNLTFWYHMNGVGIGDLSLIREDNNGSTALWSKHGRQHIDWLQAAVALTAGTFQLSFTTTVIRPHSSDIALDDIILETEPKVFRTRPPFVPTTSTTTRSPKVTTTIKPTTTLLTPLNLTCPVHDPGLTLPGSCDFEVSKMCGYSSTKTSSVQWLRNKGYRGSIVGEHIAGDHGTGKGYYVFLRTDDNSNIGENATLTSPELSKETRTCLQFAYIIVSKPEVTLNVYAVTSGSRVRLAVIKDHGMTSWEVFNVSLCAETDTQIQFEAAKEDYLGYVGLDDITITGGDYCQGYNNNASSSSTLTIENSTISCDFEDGLCDWSDVSSSKYGWKINSGRTPDFTSGPQNDHTFGDYFGHYMLAIGGKAERTSVAVLRSKFVNISNAANLTFWYHMNGNGVGNLSLVREENQMSTLTTLWTRQGRQDMDWLQAVVDINPGIFRLRFESTVYRPHGSDITLDDIHLSSEPMLFRTRPPTTTTTTTVTTTTATTTFPTYPPLTCPVRDPGLTLQGSCDFEVSKMCGYKTTTTTSVQWLRTKGFKGSIFSEHISGDHGTGKGYYVYLRTDGNSVNGEKASLTSPYLNKQTRVCLQFAYIIISTPEVTLKLYAVTSGSRVPIAAITDHEMKSWAVHNVSLCAETDTRIEFEAERRAYLGFVGLDDIVISSGRCGETYKVDTPSPVPELSTKSTDTNVKMSSLPSFPASSYSVQTSPSVTSTTPSTSTSGLSTHHLNPMKQSTYMSSAAIDKTSSGSSLPSHVINKDEYTTPDISSTPPRDTSTSGLSTHHLKPMEQSTYMSAAAIDTTSGSSLPSHVINKEGYTAPDISSTPPRDISTSGLSTHHLKPMEQSTYMSSASIDTTTSGSSVPSHVINKDGYTTPDISSTPPRDTSTSGSSLPSHVINKDGYTTPDISSTLPRDISTSGSSLPSHVINKNGVTTPDTSSAAVDITMSPNARHISGAKDSKSTVSKDTGKELSDDEKLTIIVLSALFALLVLVVIVSVIKHKQLKKSKVPGSKVATSTLNIRHNRYDDITHF